MRAHWLISIVSLISYLYVLSPSTASSQESKFSERDRRVLRIQQLIQEHDLENASRELSESIKQYPEDGGFDNLLGIVQAQQGHYATAEVSFHQAIAKDPKFTGAYLNLGRLYQENLAIDSRARGKALEVYRRVLEYDPFNAEAHYQSAVLFLQQREYRKSLDELSRLPSEKQNSAQALSLRCAANAELGDHKGTEDAAGRLILAPDFSEPDVQQALAGLLPAKRDDLVISVLESWQNRQQLSAAWLQILGSAYERTGRLAEARAALEKSFTGEKPSVDLLLQLTRIARSQKDYRGALGYLAHARDLEPNNPSLHYYFGVVCMDQTLIAEARNSFEKAVKLDSQNPDYNYAMGVTSSFRTDPAEAVPYFEKYIELKPQDPRGKLAMGAALFRAKDYNAALPWLKQSAEIPETAIKAHYYLGEIALAEGRLDEALIQLREALTAAPDYADALAELGHYYLMRKDYAQADAPIRHALAIDSYHYKANFYLLMLYTRTKDSRQEEQAKRFEELKKLLAERTQEILRVVEVRPLGTL